MKYLVKGMEKLHSIKRRAIFTDHLYTSIESANRLLARDITTVEAL